MVFMKHMKWTVVQYQYFLIVILIIVGKYFLRYSINRLLISFFASILADLAKYEIGKLLGSGSFGQVVAATRKSDDKPVGVLVSEN